ncbi:hypothetical protein C1C98_14285 [Pseudomonas ogarae]|uniref:Secreted protein n=1 Tax=Pseudomonas ogarae (strain DSM 112162 / CECT 30235 / F113) TaxID=1114970 RepID=A0ABN5G8F9_PSEO1|nr:hypothetical protein C1C98_14285 [Pseudomonas ogarae]
MAGLLWRGDLSPLGCAAAPLVSAAHSNGDKSPRHKSQLHSREEVIPAPHPPQAWQTGAPVDRNTGRSPAS